MDVNYYDWVGEMTSAAEAAAAAKRVLLRSINSWCGVHLQYPLHWVDLL